MVEYHGWITCRPSPDIDDEDDDDVRMRAIVSAVEAEVASRRADHREIRSRFVNDCYFLWFCGCTNHWGPDIEDVRELLASIANIAPGSYGLVYVWNDEDPEHGNAFRVWRLARGTVSEHADPFPSPCNPRIEA